MCVLVITISPLRNPYPPDLPQCQAAILLAAQIRAAASLARLSIWLMTAKLVPITVNRSTVDSRLQTAACSFAMWQLATVCCRLRGAPMLQHQPDNSTHQCKLVPYLTRSVCMFVYTNQRKIIQSSRAQSNRVQLVLLVQCCLRMRACAFSPTQLSFACVACLTVSVHAHTHTHTNTAIASDCSASSRGQMWSA